MKTCAETIRTGDVILPPARELSLWMRTRAREHGLPESEITMTVVRVRTGAPDKGGAWLIVEGVMSEAWNAALKRERPFGFSFRVRPRTPWRVVRHTEA